MDSKRNLLIQIAFFVIALSPLLSLANEADQPVAEPHAQHHETAPTAPNPSDPGNPQAPAKVEPEAPKAEESSSKGLVVHRAPDFCMKKDPPPHCSE